MKDCSYRVQPIPENYLGTLTIGTTALTTQNVVVRFEKYASVEFAIGTADGAGLITVPVDEALNNFFSSGYDHYQVRVLSSNNAPQKLVLGVNEYDYLELPFSTHNCNLVAYNHILIEDLETKCQAC